MVIYECSYNKPNLWMMTFGSFNNSCLVLRLMVILITLWSYKWCFLRIFSKPFFLVLTLNIFLYRKNYIRRCLRWIQMMTCEHVVWQLTLLLFSDKHRLIIFKLLWWLWWLTFNIIKFTNVYVYKTNYVTTTKWLLTNENKMIPLSLFSCFMGNK